MSDNFTMAGLWHLMEKSGAYDQGGKKNNNWKNGTGEYAKRVKGSCNRCGTREGRMVVHHKDADRKHNAPSNNETLCWSCHEKTKSRARGLKVSNKKTKKKCKEGIREAIKGDDGPDILKKIQKMVKSGKIK